MNNHRGLLIVMSGPSGCGKGTVVKRLLEMRNDTVLSVSATTRKPRPGEIDGQHYFFLSTEEFEKKLAENGFLEHAVYNGTYYGTPCAEVEKQLAAGKNVLLEIEVQGAEIVMNQRSELVSVFLTVPSMQELERRLRGRGTETEEAITHRLQAAARELSRAQRYQYVVLNDDVERATARLNAVIEAELIRYDRMKDVIMEVEKDAETDRY